MFKKEKWPEDFIFLSARKNEESITFKKMPLGGDTCLEAPVLTPQKWSTIYLFSVS